MVPITNINDNEERTRPEPKLSGLGLTLALLLACFLPLGGLTIYAVIAGGAHDNPLPVAVTAEQRMIPRTDGLGAVPADVIVIKNLSDHEIPRLTIDLNGQYFLHQDAPLKVGEELVLLQEVFATKSNQRWEPGAYPLKEINITGQLPTKGRGVLEVRL